MGLKKSLYSKKLSFSDATVDVLAKLSCPASAFFPSEPYSPKLLVGRKNLSVEFLILRLVQSPAGPFVFRVEGTLQLSARIIWPEPESNLQPMLSTLRYNS